jgi:tRNA(fMet)-specific endonuclease VapC
VSWLLDTNTCIFLMKMRERLVSRVRTLSPDDLAVASITCAELWFGAARSQHPRRNRDVQDAFLAPMRVLDFNAKAADRYARIRAELARTGRQIGDRDAMIAAIALANDLGVLTSDTSEFRRVPGLRVEDWMIAGEG